MARTVTSPLQIARNILAQGKGFFLFVEVPSVSGGFFRLVRNNRPLSADGKVWQAAEMGITIPEETADGSLGQLAITIPNVSRVPLALIESGDILGQDLTLWLQHENTFSAFVPGLSWQHRAVKASGNERIAITCGHPAGLLRVPFPVYDRTEFPQLLPGGAK
jgi:hypothetical protein